MATRPALTQFSTSENDPAVYTESLLSKGDTPSTSSSIVTLFQVSDSCPPSITSSYNGDSERGT